MDMRRVVLDLEMNMAREVNEFADNVAVLEVAGQVHLGLSGDRGDGVGTKMTARLIPAEAVRVAQALLETARALPMAGADEQTREPLGQPRQQPEMARLLVDIARRVGGSLDLQHTLDQVVAGVVELLGFGVAVLNLKTPEGSLEVVSVAGPEASRAQLLGSRQSRSVWDALLAAARPIGALRFVHHDDTALMDAVFTWFPDMEVSDDDGSWHPMDALFAPLHSSDGELLGVLSVDCPADGLVPGEHQCQLLELFAIQAALALDNAQAHAQLERSEQVLRTTFENAPVGMAVYGPDGRLASANRAFCAFLGRDENELRGRTVADFTHPDDRQATDQVSLAVQQRTGVVYKFDQRYVHADGATVWGRLSLTWIDGGDGRDQVLAQIEDITAERSARAELERQARTDALTGLANRPFVMQMLGEALDSGWPVAVLFCDVDHFKTVNDTLGHAAGDDLLVQIGRDLAAVLRPHDRAGRLGGDEFVLVLQISDPAEAVAAAERVRRTAARTITVAGRSVLTSMSIGVAMAGRGQVAAEVLAAADRALYAAKQAGRDRTHLA